MFTGDFRDSTISGAVGKGRWKWVEEYMWEVKQLENQISITFSRSFNEKGRPERRYFFPFFLAGGQGSANQTWHMCSDRRRVSLSRSYRHRRERKYSRDLEEGWEQVQKGRGRERTAGTVHAGIT